MTHVRGGKYFGLIERSLYWAKTEEKECIRWANGRGYSTNFCRMAKAAAAARLFTPSLLKICTR